MGQRRDDDVAILFAPHRPLLDGALAGLVDFADVIARRDDLGVGRVVRPLHMGHQGI